MEIRTPPIGPAGTRREEAAGCLLAARDAATEHPALDGAGLQLWLEFEEAAHRYGIDPDLPREGLAAAARGCVRCPKARPEAA